MIKKLIRSFFITFGLFFIGSALLKLLYPEDIIIFDYPYIDKLLYILLIQIETVLGLFLVFKPSKLVIYSALFFIFILTVYALIKVVTGADSDCGCFGSAIKRNYETAFKENFLLLFTFLIAVVLKKKGSTKIISKGNNT